MVDDEGGFYRGEVLDLPEQEAADAAIAQAEEERPPTPSNYRASEGRPANGANRVYYDKDYLARTRGDRFHRLTNREILDTVNGGKISEDTPGYVEYRLPAEKYGRSGYFEVGGYYTGRGFVVEHRLFIPVKG